MRGGPPAAVLPSSQEPIAHAAEASAMHGFSAAERRGHPRSVHLADCTMTQILGGGARLNRIQECVCACS